MDRIGRWQTSCWRFVCSLVYRRYCQCTWIDFSLLRTRARTHTNLHTDSHLVSYSCPFVRYICQASSVTYGSANTRRLINSVHDGGIAAQLTPYPPGITLYDIRLDFAEIGLVPEHYADALAGPEPAQRQTTSLYLTGYGGRILSIVLKKIDTILREAGVSDAS